MIISPSISDCWSVCKPTGNPLSKAPFLLLAWSIFSITTRKPKMTEHCCRPLGSEALHDTAYKSNCITTSTRQICEDGRFFECRNRSCSGRSERNTHSISQKVRSARHERSIVPLHHASRGAFGGSDRSERQRASSSVASLVIC